MTATQVFGLSGELVAAPSSDIPFAPGFNLEQLREVDPDPLFATVKIRPGRGNGGKGPNYGPAVLQDIARQVNEKRPPGYRGHQQADRVDWEWREPATAWVGARWDEAEQVLYVKGYVPPTAGELRTQLNLAKAGADVVNSVSIFGLRGVDGDEVSKFDIWSIDWTPKGRAGMETELVGVTGEQREEEMDRAQIIASITAEELPAHVQDQLRNEGRQAAEHELEPVVSAVGEMRVILEVEEGDTDALVSAVRGLVEERDTDEFESTVATAVETEVSGELMQAAVRERVLSRLSAGASPEDIAGEIASAKELPHIKALGAQKVPVVRGHGETKETQRRGTRWV